MARDPIRLKIKSVQPRVQSVRLRIPFRFGATTLTEAPLLTLQARAEDKQGRAAIGYSSDLLIGMWFDKSPGKSIDRKVDDELEMISVASDRYLDLGGELVTPFELWSDVYPSLQKTAAERGIQRAVRRSRHRTPDPHLHR